MLWNHEHDFSIHTLLNKPAWNAFKWSWSKRIVEVISRNWHRFGIREHLYAREPRHIVRPFLSPNEKNLWPGHTFRPICLKKKRHTSIYSLFTIYFILYQKSATWPDWLALNWPAAPVLSSLFQASFPRRQRFEASSPEGLEGILIALASIGDRKFRSYHPLAKWII